MPRAVMEAGLADEEVDLSSMAEAILAEVSS
jgi:chemotaxis response regulator CheB